jgi:hypothetical protein
MKRIVINIFFVFCFVSIVFGQAKKPTLMVMPSDQWCVTRGYVVNFDNQGLQETVSDYNAAVKDVELMNVISKINILMTDRGFPLKDLSQTLKAVAQMSAEDALIQNSATGSTIVESPLDKLRRTAKADIILDLTWNLNKIGPKTSVTYNLRGLDAYTGKQIAGVQGTGEPSFSQDIAVLLEEAVLVNIDNFNYQLQSFFDDMAENGREVTLDIRVFDNAEGINLDTEVDPIEYYTLAEVIDNWLAENTVQHRFSKSDGSENFALYEQVRIPLYKTNGMAMDTETFARELRRFLMKNYQMPCKIINRGLGRCLIIIGEK